MSLVTATEVKGIMPGCTVLDTVIDTFIISADELITKIFAGDASITPTLLKELERWLTAHMLASTVARMGSEEQLGEAKIKYTGLYEKNLESTPYGQMLLILDTTGKLKATGKQTISIHAITSFE